MKIIGYFSIALLLYLLVWLSAYDLFISPMNLDSWAGGFILFIVGALGIVLSLATIILMLKYKQMHFSILSFFALFCGATVWGFTIWIFKVDWHRFTNGDYFRHPQVLIAVALVNLVFLIQLCIVIFGKKKSSSFF